MEAVHELAFDQDLAGVGRITDEVFEDVTGEDDRLGAVVVRLISAAVRLDARPI
jgi:protein involved in temperature-dependent protein secretion